MRTINYCDNNTSIKTKFTEKALCSGNILSLIFERYSVRVSAGLPDIRDFPQSLQVNSRILSSHKPRLLQNHYLLTIHDYFPILFDIFLEDRGKVKLYLCFNRAPRHKEVLGEWRYCSTP